jgi:glycosyltransferase involved in cell wall biosynthesis
MEARPRLLPPLQVRHGQRVQGSLRLKLVVGIATAGRREQVGLTLEQLAHQTRSPDLVIVCPASPADYDTGRNAALPFPIAVVEGPRGLAAQRNRIVAACGEADALVFFDDDFYAAPDYLYQAEALLVGHDEVVIARGEVLADGATGPGLTPAEALRALSLAPAAASPPRLVDTYGAYGCNMIVRMAPVLAHGLRFDENLPLYGWLEDIDFARSMAPYGRVVKSTLLRGVHLGVKRGRTSGVKLGYSQIANPLYMLRKGTLCRSYAFRQMGRNVARNLARALVPEPWVDRRGRLKGNLMALADLLRGRLDPRRILRLE